MLGGAAYLFLNQPAFADQHPVFKNGTLDGEGRLDWSNGGGDPLQTHLRRDTFRQALALPRLNFEPGLQAVMRQALRGNPGKRITLHMYDRQVLQGVMISGDGWLAMRPRVMTHQWVRQTFGATTWFVTYINTDGNIERWQVIVADVCGNLILIPRGGALPCLCDSRLDACGAVL